MSRPRIRSLKPDCFQDEALGAVGFPERLLFIGLITMSDDDGRLRYLPSAISGHVFPYDELAPARIKKMVGELERHGLIHTYSPNGHSYIQLVNWRKHQRIDKPSPSELPAPDLETEAA